VAWVESESDWIHSAFALADAGVGKRRVDSSDDDRHVKAGTDRYVGSR